jgi:hypothetical protein
MMNDTLKTHKTDFVIDIHSLCENFNAFKMRVQNICKYINYQKHPPQYLDVFQDSTYLAALNKVFAKYLSYPYRRK